MGEWQTPRSESHQAVAVLSSSFDKFCWGEIQKIDVEGDVRAVVLVVQIWVSGPSWVG